MFSWKRVWGDDMIFEPEFMVQDTTRTEKPVSGRDSNGPNETGTRPERDPDETGTGRVPFFGVLFFRL